MKSSNLFESFHPFLFFARRLAAAKGWIYQSLSLRKGNKKGDSNYLKSPFLFSFFLCENLLPSFFMFSILFIIL
jgi:hypothetical protein